MCVCVFRSALDAHEEDLKRQMLITNLLQTTRFSNFRVIQLDEMFYVTNSIKVLWGCNRDFL